MWQINFLAALFPRHFATQIFLVKFLLFPVKFFFGKNYLADDEKT